VPLPCRGDCNDDRQIGADELTLLIAEALEDVVMCDDGTGSTTATIETVVEAVNQAAVGCP